MNKKKKGWEIKKDISKEKINMDKRYEDKEEHRSWETRRDKKKEKKNKEDEKQ